tara:strand:- start:817 stop:1095 length:279 start_codon:yes stop_codon:yes gene_type:complete
MKITKQQLKQIIKEELQTVMEMDDEGYADAYSEMADRARKFASDYHDSMPWSSDRHSKTKEITAALEEAIPELQKYEGLAHKIAEYEVWDKE